MLSAPGDLVVAERAAAHGVGHRSAMCGLEEKCPGDASNRPAPVAR